MTTTDAVPRAVRVRLGLTFMLAAALGFSTSGVLLSPLIEAGWSPAAAVALRVAIAGIVLAVPALVALRGDLSPLLRAWRHLLAYGVIAVAGTQVLYFAAIQHLPVAIALLIQYSAPVLIAVLGWATGRIRVHLVVVLGVVSSVVGLLLVVGLDEAQGRLDAIGVVLALASAVCLAGYYLLSARPTPGLPPIALVATGLLVGAAVTTLVGVTGLLPWSVTTGSVRLGSVDLPWWVPMLLVALLATAAAYCFSLAGSRRLGSRLASFAGLTEVIFAAVFSWILLGQELGWVQMLGGAAILLGVVLVGQDHQEHAESDGPPDVAPAGVPGIDPLTQTDAIAIIPIRRDEAPQ